MNKFIACFVLSIILVCSAYAETQKITRVVGDNQETGWKAFISIANQSSSVVVFTLDRYGMDGAFLWETEHTIQPLCSILIKPDELYKLAHQIEITGPDGSLLVVPWQYDENGNLSILPVFNVTSGKLLSNSETAVQIESTPFLQYEGDPGCKYTREGFKLALEAVTQQIYYAFPDRPDTHTWVCSATPLFGACPGHG